MRAWSSRRWAAAVVGAAAALLALGLPTDLVPNPVFGRGIPAPGWSLPVLVVTAVLSGLLLATYVRDEERDEAPGRGEVSGSWSPLGAALPEESSRATAGGLLSFFAIGCPTCNKLVLVALGSSGAVTWFQPLQPLLAGAGVLLLAWALRRRLRADVSCALPVG
jgi:hypothetical protein